MYIVNMLYGSTVSIKFIACYIQFKQFQDKNRHGAEAARAAHNREDLGSKPSVGIISIYQVHRLVYTIQDIHYKKDKNRHGAGVARGAHNSEVTGSKPVAGIISVSQVHHL